MKKITVFAVALLVTVSTVSTAYAVAGLGFHWGFDLSLSMDEVNGERVGVPSPNLSTINIPGGVLDNINDIDFIKVSRANWKASAINFGGKAYIDIIPFIETIELSLNFGLWQYDGALSYADFSATGIQNIITSGGTVDYIDVPLTIGAVGLPKYIGISGTPYAKLQLDATVRKTLLNLWIIKLSGGAGLSSHFSTPLLTAKIIEDVVGTSLSDPTDFVNLLKPGGKISKDIVQKIIDEAMGNPVFGMHILLGFKAKLPVVPIGIYVDGKYMIPFTKYDADAGSKSINGFGLLVNAGLSLSI